MKHVLTSLTAPLLTLMLLSTVGCEDSISKETCEASLPSDYGETLNVPDHKFIMTESLGRTTIYGQAPIFGDIFTIAGIPATKSGIALSDISIVNLLDIEKIEEENINGVSVTQIPFKTSIDYQEIALQCSEEDMGWTASKRFYVFTETQDEYLSQIVTLIPTPETLERYGPHSFSFLNRARFDGLVIYSRLDGTITDAIWNKSGPLDFGQLCPLDETDMENINIKIMIPINIETKTTLIHESICIGYKSYRGELDDDLQNGNSNGNVPDHGDYGNQNEEDQTEDKLADDGRGIRPGNNKGKDPTLYYIQLGIYGSGDVKGSGTYTKGYPATIKATGKDGYAFIRWDGDFAGRDDSFIIEVNHNMRANVFFQRDKSCFDKEKKVNAVINSTTIAKTSSGSIKGGSFGWTRTKVLKDTLDALGNRIIVPKHHNGIDFLAQPGTPIFAPADGEIIYVVSDIPNKETNNRNENAGNRIWLKTDDGVIWKYFHLRAPEDGGALAFGLCKGSRVIRGQMIGYTGKTGNAFNDVSVPNKHLHLETWVNGAAVNPENYINGTLDIEAGTIVVKCDNEFEANNYDSFYQF